VRFIVHCSSLLLLSGLWAGRVEASTTLTLRPSADAYTTEDLPSNNFGSAGALAVSGSANAKGPLQSILRFDLATITSALDVSYGIGGWVVDSILLELTSTTPLNANFNPNAAGAIAVDWLSDDSWLESTVTWNGLPGIVTSGSQSLGTLSYAGGLGTTQYLLLSSAGFLSDLQSGAQASLLLSAADPNVSVVMNSRNFGTVASRPALIITASAVPEPHRAMLAVVGVAALGLRRTRGTHRP
jgi:hypothetical protein